MTNKVPRPNLRLQTGVGGKIDPLPVDQTTENKTQLQDSRKGATTEIGSGDADGHESLPQATPELPSTIECAPKHSHGGKPQTLHNKHDSECALRATNEVVTVMPRITGECSIVVEAVCSIVFILVVIESS